MNTYRLIGFGFYLPKNFDGFRFPPGISSTTTTRLNLLLMPALRYILHAHGRTYVCTYDGCQCAEQGQILKLNPETDSFNLASFNSFVIWLRIRLDFTLDWN